GSIDGQCLLGSDPTTIVEYIARHTVAGRFCTADGIDRQRPAADQTAVFLRTWSTGVRIGQGLAGSVHPHVTLRLDQAGVVVQYTTVDRDAAVAVGSISVFAGQRGDDAVVAVIECLLSGIDVDLCAEN